MKNTVKLMLIVFLLAVMAQSSVFAQTNILMTPPKVVADQNDKLSQSNDKSDDSSVEEPQEPLSRRLFRYIRELLEDERIPINDQLVRDDS